MSISRGRKAEKFIVVAVYVARTGFTMKQHKHIASPLDTLGGAVNG